MRRLSPRVRNHIAQLLADAVLAAIAFSLAFWLRFIDVPGGIPSNYAEMLAGSVAVVAIGKSLLFELMGLHEKWWRYFLVRDFPALLRATLLASVLMVVCFTLLKPFPQNLPRSVIAYDFLLTTALLAGARIAIRLWIERPSRGSQARRSRRSLIVGAGSGGQMVVRELQLNPGLATEPIGFLDDDPRKQGMGLLGLRVLGTTDRIDSVLAEWKPDEVVIAIPSASGTMRAKVVAACRARRIPVRTLPTVFELLQGGVQLTRQLREVQVEDVLGRDPVRMELSRVGAYLEDKVVLVTGAGGSIGSELSRQIARVDPRLLVLLDHAEDNLFRIDRELTGHRSFSKVESVLADCKEGDRMLEVMQRFRPDVVFHAAAYKHVGLMETNPLEAVRNNAIATRVTAETAAVAGASRFVLVSTDKAVSPATVMGASKAMAEWIVSAAGQRHATTRFVTVRFGNVLGSSGSVVPIFRSQIEQGGPVTVTHPEMTRYFMTIPEAVQLVIKAGDLGSSTGEVFVLEMGQPVRIIDLARNMIELAGYEPETEIAIEFTGPRPGEKLHEDLFNGDERSQPTSADRIVRAVRASELDPDWVEETVARLCELVASGDEAGLAARLVELVSSRPQRESIDLGSFDV